MSAHAATPPPGTRRRLGHALLLALAALVLLPTAAVADPPAPTSYRSSVSAVSSPVDGVDVRVIGGDAFLQLTAPEGTEVVVLGYGDGGVEEEPYLRFPADGGVEVNTSSPAYHLNQDRYALEPVPAGADAAAPPTWSRVADGRTWAWHDHRVHWMSPQPPPQVATDAGAVQPVLDWSVPLVVDDEPAAVDGSLVWLPSRSPVLPALVVVVAALAAAVLVRRAAGSATGRAGVVVAVAAVLALGAATATLLAPGAEPAASLPAVVVPAVALVLAVAVVTGRAAGREVATLVVASLAVAVHVALGAATLVRPVLPSLLPTAPAWVLPALALGLVVGAAGALLAPPAPAPQPAPTVP